VSLEVFLVKPYEQDDIFLCLYNLFYPYQIINLSTHYNAYSMRTTIIPCEIKNKKFI